MRPLIIIGFLFFVFGFVTWMSSVLVPYLQIACELDQFESQLVAFAFYISYFVMAVPSGYLLKKSGLKNGMAIGLLVMALGATTLFLTLHLMAIRNEILRRRVARLTQQAIQAGESEALEAAQ